VFVKAKIAYGLKRIKARLQSTFDSCIVIFVLVLTLPKLGGNAPYCLIFWLATLSAKGLINNFNWAKEKLLSTSRFLFFSKVSFFTFSADTNYLFRSHTIKLLQFSAPLIKTFRKTKNYLGRN
jgi:hypothetical protein